MGSGRRGGGGEGWNQWAGQDTLGSMEGLTGPRSPPREQPRGQALRSPLRLEPCSARALRDPQYLQPPR